MAIVEGTGMAEEVYYAVDLAFRHLLVEEKSRYVPKSQINMEIEDSTPIPSNDPWAEQIQIFKSAKGPVSRVSSESDDRKKILMTIIALMSGRTRGLAAYLLKGRKGFSGVRYKLDGKPDDPQVYVRYEDDQVQSKLLIKANLLVEEDGRMVARVNLADVDSYMDAIIFTPTDTELETLKFAQERTAGSGVRSIWIRR